MNCLWSTKLLEYTYITETNEVKTIRVELADTDFVKYWIHYLQDLSVKLPNINWYVGATNGCLHESKADAMIPNLGSLYSCFSYFQKNNLYDFTEEMERILKLISNPSGLTHLHLNNWHRQFTTLERKYLLLEEKVPDTIDKKELFFNIQDINMYTHKCEDYVYYKMRRRAPFKGKAQYGVQFTDANNLNYIKAGVFDENHIVHIPEQYTFDFFTENYDYDVWLHEHITGKDQFKAFLEEDDLTQFDITGNMLMTPAVTFDPNDIYKSILEDPVFQVESKKTNKKLNRFPIGRMVDRHLVDWDEILTAKIQKIVLNGNVLWQNT